MKQIRRIGHIKTDSCVIAEFWKSAQINKGGGGGRPERRRMLYLVDYEVTVGEKKALLTDIVDTEDAEDAWDEAEEFCHLKRAMLGKDATAEVMEVREL